MRIPGGGTTACPRRRAGQGLKLAWAAGAARRPNSTGPGSAGDIRQEPRKSRERERSIGPRDPRLCSGKSSFIGGIDIERGGVQHQGIRRRSQRGGGPGVIQGVAGLDIGEYRFEVAINTSRPQFLPAATGTCLSACGHEKFYRSVGKDDRSDVAPVQHCAVRPETTLQIQ